MGDEDGIVLLCATCRHHQARDKGSWGIVIARVARVMEAIF
jgi:hypothetical protein